MPLTSADSYENDVDPVDEAAANPRLGTGFAQHRPWVAMRA